MGGTGCWDLFPASITFRPPFARPLFSLTSSPGVGWPLPELLTQEGREGGRERGAERVFFTFFPSPMHGAPTSACERTRETGEVCGGGTERVKGSAPAHGALRSEPQIIPAQHRGHGRNAGKERRQYFASVLPLLKAGEAAGPSPAGSRP